MASACAAWCWLTRSATSPRGSWRCETASHRSASSAPPNVWATVRSPICTGTTCSTPVDSCGKGGREAAPAVDDDIAEPQPDRQARELRRELSGCLRRCIRLAPGRLDPQDPRLPVGLQVDPGDELVAEQERQHVIAVHPLPLRHVDLQPVPKPEQGFGAGPLPDQRIERAEQGPRGHPAREASVTVQVSRALPTLDHDRRELSLLDELAECPPRGGHLEPEVVPQALLGADSVCPGSDADQLALRIVERGRRC